MDTTSVGGTGSGGCNFIITGSIIEMMMMDFEDGVG